MSKNVFLVRLEIGFAGHDLDGIMAHKVLVSDWAVAVHLRVMGTYRWAV